MHRSLVNYSPARYVVFAAALALGTSAALAVPPTATKPSTPPASAPTASEPQSTAPPMASPQGTAAPQSTAPQAKAPVDQSTSATPTAAQDNSGTDAQTSASTAPGTGQTLSGIKTGSVDDVNAVGNRDIGARGMGNWYSTESEIKMGKGYAQEIEKSTKFISDPVVTEYVNRIGQNLVKNSDAKVPFTIKVIDSDVINAMALPGGFFYVNSGLILNADEEAELAGVMAHEIGHVAAHHAAREMTRSNYAQIGSLASEIFIPGWIGYGIYEASSIGIPLTFLHFSREFEAQADYLGVQYMYRAGYDPQAFVTFFEKIQALEKRKPGTVSKAFATHPQTPDRIEHSQAEIARILPPRNEYVVTTSEFDDVKARLARLQSKRTLTDPKDGKKPTLRRASTTNDPTSTSSTPPDSTDDKPTLHRRDN